MASCITPSSSSPTNGATNDEIHKTHQEFLDVLSKLPKEKGWLTEHDHQYKGFWYPTRSLQGLLALEHNFKPKQNDVLLASFPKSGTTWLKALVFAITNRANYDFDKHPLLSSNPHQLIPYLEDYAFTHPKNPTPETSITHTHVPFHSLPESASCLKIVYVCRDPKDVLVSLWHFAQKLRPNSGLPSISLQEAFDLFSKGRSPFGPFWDHIIGYYKASLEYPNRVFFLKYEEMKKYPIFHTKRLAEFLEQPFSLEEESEGVAEKITELCSFEKLSNLEVNKSGIFPISVVPAIANHTFFRKGEVGDSKNHFSKEMIEVLDEIISQKLAF